MMRPHIAEKYIDIVNKLKPKPKTIYFGHDLHYLRLERQAELSGDGAAMAEASHWKEKEYKLFQKFDLIYYPSQVEIDEIHSKDPALPVKAIPLYAFAPLSEDPVDPAKRTDLLFVGGFNHPPNADGLNWFMEDVFPSVLDNIPDLRIHIVGSKMPDEIRDLASNSVVVHGFISDEELEDLYSRIRMSVVPLRFGAGMKGKVLESLYYGVPLITTSIGAEGIPGSSDAMFVADDADEMSRCLIEGYCDLEKLSELSASGKKIINAHFSTDTVLGLIEKDFIVS
jgi:glycosyltransferase involved in cell wall biosynthesis